MKSTPIAAMLGAVPTLTSVQKLRALDPFALEEETEGLLGEIIRGGAAA